MITLTFSRHRTLLTLDVNPKHIVVKLVQTEGKVFVKLKYSCLRFNLLNELFKAPSR